MTEPVPSTTPFRIGAVLLHYRRWPDVCGAIDHLLNQTLPPSQFIVLDNASNDESYEQLTCAYPDTAILAASDNRGYAAGMNLGVNALELTTCDAILLLTHDCQLAPDALELLTKRLNAEPTLGAVGPLLGDRSRPGAVWSAGGEVCDRTWDFTHRRTPALLEHWRGAGPRDSTWLDGACVLVRTTAWHDVAGLDERYFLYIEDVDFSFRLRRAGWSLECVPAAVGWQSAGGLLNRYLLTRNRLLFLRAHAPRRIVIRETIRAGYHILRRLRASRLRARGLMDGLSGALHRNALRADNR